MICLTFDTDHLDEELMREFLGEVPVPGEGTFFCTQPYPSLESTPHELGPHPLLEPGGDWGAALDEAREWFPDAEGFRAHSCVHSHALALELGERGYRYVSASGGGTGEPVDPYRETWGVWHLPVYYMDNLDFAFADRWPGTDREPFSKDVLERATRSDDVFVFGFHPIHLLFNSPSTAVYMERRQRMKQGEPVEAIRFDGYGTRSFYDELLALMDSAGIASQSLGDAHGSVSAA